MTGRSGRVGAEMQHAVAIPSAHVPHMAGETLLIVPQYQANQPAVGETLQYESRLPEQARKYGGIPVVVRKPASEIPGLYPPNQSLEQIELIADVQVPAKKHSYTDAVERFSPVFGTLIDLLAFDMAAVPGFGQVDIVDISPPVSVGEERFATSFSELPFDRYMRSNELLSVHGRRIGELPESVDDSIRKHRPSCAGT